MTSYNQAQMLSPEYTTRVAQAEANADDVAEVIGDGAGTPPTSAGDTPLMENLSDRSTRQ
jgi:hypothetical protein